MASGGGELGILYTCPLTPAHDEPRPIRERLARRRRLDVRSVVRDSRPDPPRPAYRRLHGPPIWARNEQQRGVAGIGCGLGFSRRHGRLADRTSEISLQARQRARAGRQAGSRRIRFLREVRRDIAGSSDEGAGSRPARVAGRGQSREARPVRTMPPPMIATAGQQLAGHVEEAQGPAVRRVGAYGRHGPARARCCRAASRRAGCGSGDPAGPDGDPCGHWCCGRERAG